MSLSPAKKTALKVVVADCETPPPRSSANTPELMTKPFTNPFAAVRSPTRLFMLQVSPGSTSDSLISLAARPMLVTR